MSEPKFTPGPWKVWRQDNTSDPGFAWVQVNRDARSNEKVCHMNILHPQMSPSERENILANAALISAAPEMYNALEGFYEYVKMLMPEFAGILGKILAKARGEVQE